MKQPDSQAQAAPAGPISGAAGGIPEVLAAGFAAHGAGRLAEAESAYRSVLRHEPGNPEALHLLGLARHKAGAAAEAVELIERAVARRPGHVPYLVNLGAVLLGAGRLPQAEQALEQAVALQPKLPIALSNLSLARERMGLLYEAVDPLLTAAKLTGDVRHLRRLVRLLIVSGDAEGARRIGQAAADGDNPVLRDDPEINALVGRLFELLGENERSKHYYGRAHALGAGSVEAALNHARAAFRAGDFDACGELLADLADAHRVGTLDVLDWMPMHALTWQLVYAGRPSAAIRAFGAMAKAWPAVTTFHAQLGSLLHGIGSYQAAMECFEAALKLEPENAWCLVARGYVHMSMGRFDLAVGSFEKALRAAPHDVLAMSSLVTLFAQSRQLDRATVWSRRLLLADPENMKYYGCLAMVLQGACDYGFLDELGDPHDRVEAGQAAVACAGLLPLLARTETPEQAHRLMRVARAWGKQIEEVGRIARLKPWVPPGSDAAEASEGDGQGAEPGAPGTPPAAPLPRRFRPVRVGLLSSDMRAHSVAKFVTPLFRSYDPERMRLTVYSPYPGGRDPTAEEIKGKIAAYNEVHALSDAELVEKMRGDGLDVLVELNGVTMFSRLGAMVHRSAPVQLEWLGYPFTTGIAQIDGFIVDRYLRPTQDDLLYERPVELPGSWICFGWRSSEKVAEAPPAAKAGYVTFGSLNNVYKYSRPTVAMWAEVMKRVPRSRFLVVRPEAQSAILRANLASEFARHGVETGRIEFFDNWANSVLSDACYNHFDISLDTAPLTGGTTTVDSLEMGVPVVTMRGPAMHQRISHAIVSHVGLGDLSAETPEGFIDAAVGLANDLDRLTDLKRTLRDRLSASALCDGPGFAAGFAATMAELAGLPEAG